MLVTSVPILSAISFFLFGIISVGMEGFGLMPDGRVEGVWCVLSVIPGLWSCLVSGLPVMNFYSWYFRSGQGRVFSFGLFLFLDLLSSFLF